VGVLFDLLTNGADPDGLDAPKPLQPTTASKLVLSCGQVHTVHYRFGNGHTNVLQQMLRRDFAALWARSHPLARKYLDDLCIKYAVNDWKLFVPPKLHGDVPGRLPRETTLTESFPGTSATLGGDLTWTEMGTDWDNISGVGRSHNDTDTAGYARAESDLSSADHYAKCLVQGIGSAGENVQVGPLSRFDAGAQTGYIARVLRVLDQIRLTKTVAGSMTDLGQASITITTGVLAESRSDGSTIKAYWNAVEQVSVTDTAITANTRTGLFGFSNATGSFPQVDTFEAADLGGGGGGGGGLVYTQLERDNPRGLARGVYGGPL
jgi:hypothetical protein